MFVQLFSCSARSLSLSLSLAAMSWRTSCSAVMKPRTSHFQSVKQDIRQCYVHRPRISASCGVRTGRETWQLRRWDGQGVISGKCSSSPRLPTFILRARSIDAPAHHNCAGTNEPRPIDAWLSSKTLCRSPPSSVGRAQGS